MAVARDRWAPSARTFAMRSVPSRTTLTSSSARGGVRATAREADRTRSSCSSSSSTAPEAAGEPVRPRAGVPAAAAAAAAALCRLPKRPRRTPQMRWTWTPPPTMPLRPRRQRARAAAPKANRRSCDQSFASATIRSCARPGSRHHPKARVLTRFVRVGEKKKGRLTALLCAGSRQCCDRCVARH